MLCIVFYISVRYVFHEILRYVLHYVYIGMSKKDREDELKQQMKRLEGKYSALQVVPIIAHRGQDQQGDIAAEGMSHVLNVHPLIPLELTVL